MSDQRWSPQQDALEQGGAGAPCRAALYARHSSPRQHSSDVQIQECRRRCDERGWRVKYILKDEARSGNDGEREGFWKLVELAEAGRIDVVVVWKIDRLVRNLAHAGVLEEQLRQHGVCIHSVTEPIDTTTPMGRFIFGNLVNAAALEREMIRERSRLGFEKSVRAGRWPRKDPPYGYRKTKNKHLRIFEAEAAQVRRVFEAYVRMGSFAEASGALNREGSTFRGSPWTVRRVRRILEHPIYAGSYTHSGITVDCPQLQVVDDETWNRAIAVRGNKPRNGKWASEDVRQAAINRIFAEYQRHLDEAFVGLPDD